MTATPKIEFGWEGETPVEPFVSKAQRELRPPKHIFILVCDITYGDCG